MPSLKRGGFVCYLISEASRLPKALAMFREMGSKGLRDLLINIVKKGNWERGIGIAGWRLERYTLVEAHGKEQWCGIRHR